MKTILNYINGEWCESSTGETVPVLNPANGEVLAEVTQSTKEDVDRAVQAGKAAHGAW